jgi:S-formylglutathione hydrolase
MQGQNVITDSFFSNTLKRDKRVNIVLPSQHDSQSRNFPVLYLLHGYGGNKATWIKNTSLLEIKQHVNLIIVLPESGRRWFINDAMGYRYEDYLLQELIPYIDTHYSTIPDRDHRAIGGFSMGGAAAVFQLLRYPEVFSIAFSHSGAYEAPLREGDPYSSFRDDSTLVMPSISDHERVWGPPGSSVRSEYDPYNLLRNWDNEHRIHLYLDVGKDDYKRMIMMNRNFHLALLKKGIHHDYFEIAGGHDWQYLNKAISRSMNFITDKLCED